MTGDLLNGVKRNRSVSFPSNRFTTGIALPPFQRPSALLLVLASKFRLAAVLNAEISSLKGRWRQQKAIADKAGLRLVMYKGGSHVTPAHNVLDQNAGLIEFIAKFHYSTQMGTLYRRAIGLFEAAGCEMFNAFVEMERSCKHGFWGALRHASDSNPRWDAIVAARGAIPAPQPVPDSVPESEPTPEPQPDPAPVPEPTPDPAPEPEPEPNPAPKEPDMADRKLLTDILSGLNTIAEAIESYLDAAPATPSPVTPPVQLPVTPPVQPPVVPPVTPVPQTLPTGYRVTQDFKIDKDLGFDWSAKGGVNIFLPNWAGGDRGKGVGGSLGTPRRVLYPDEKSVTITAGMEGGQ